MSYTNSESANLLTNASNFSQRRRIGGVLNPIGSSALIKDLASRYYQLRTGTLVSSPWPRASTISTPPGLLAHSDARHGPPRVFNAPGYSVPG